MQLIASHSIHLTREQRYQIHEGKTIETIGVCIPIWLMDNLPTDPAKEVFCKYEISYNGKNEPIQIINNGFKTLLPHRAKTGDRDSLTNEDWLKMSEKELDIWYEYNQPEVNSSVMLDYNEGGCQGLIYRESSKLVFDIPVNNNVEKRIVEVKHFISISEIENLLNSLT